MLKNPANRPVKKVPDARRARNRQAEAYSKSTLEPPRSEREKSPGGSSAPISNACQGQADGRWAFFNGLSEKNIALTGFMASGKSAVGRGLARRLKRRFVDLDQVIEKSEGMKVQEIFSSKGETYFRKLEKQTLIKILSQNGQVIATGGGAVMDEEILLLLKEKSLLVYLAATPETLLRRSGTGKGRPLLQGNDRQKQIKTLLGQREKSYAQAHVSIDTSCMTKNDVVKKIIEALSSGV